MVAKYDVSDIHLLEDSILQAGNSCQGELPFKGSLPDHRSALTEPKVYIKMVMEVPGSREVKFIAACSFPIDKYKDIMKAQVSSLEVDRYGETGLQKCLVLVTRIRYQIHVSKWKAFVSTVLKERRQRRPSDGEAPSRALEQGRQEADWVIGWVAKQGEEPLVTNIMWRNLIIQALYQVAVLLVLNFRGLTILNLKDDEWGNSVKNTLIFNGFILCQIFNEFNARKPEEILLLKCPLM
ncbi:calcium-transporting ATPase 9, plasma membrane-type protein [Tanacetum coccineum]